MRGNGGRIGAKYTPSENSSSGIWGLSEAGAYRKQSVWPPLIPPLYSFSTATFTPGGATFRIGPTLAQARSGITAASGTEWVTNTEFLNTRGTQGGIIIWTVPKTGTYTIDAYGAQGGRAGYYNIDGALGARIKGDFSLTKGQKLALVVGQQGRNDGGANWGGGGGGGSFVWLDGQTTPMLIAGGGGGGGQGSNATAGGQTGNDGGAGGAGSAGGTGGYSGGGGSCGGGNGQGWYGGTTNGCGGSTAWATVYNDPTGASGASGGQSTDASSSYAVGGFGGGNGAYGGSGGGGGYSGGGSAGWSYSYFGGGGGSYNIGTNQTNTGATRSGAGQIIITFVA